MTTKQLAVWLRRKLRYCYTMHECALCGGKILLGQYYRDGGHSRRAHDECVARHAKVTMSAEEGR